jgi:hypothetical protein
MQVINLLLSIVGYELRRCSYYCCDRCYIAHRDDIKTCCSKQCQEAIFTANRQFATSFGVNSEVIN